VIDEITATDKARMDRLVLFPDLNSPQTQKPVSIRTALELFLTDEKGRQQVLFANKVSDRVVHLQVVP
jgi:hypothetical protein